MMDADQLRELSTNALTGHWPAHLGLSTDADKIEYLARQLECVADETADAEALEEKIEDLEDANNALKEEIADRDKQISDLKK